MPRQSCVVIDNGLLIVGLWAWGWEPPSALVSFGAVLIQDHKVVDTRHWHLDLRDQVDSGATVDRGMWSWWEDRVEEEHYLGDLVSQAPRATVRDAAMILNDLRASLPLGSGIYFGNASQDAPLIISAMRRAGVEPLWSLPDQMCLNTMGRFTNG